MSAAAASSQAGSWSRQASQAAVTSSGADRPDPWARSRARASRASWRSAFSRSRARSAQPAYGSPGSNSASPARAADMASSRAWPGGIARPARRPAACSSASTMISGASHTWARSAPSSASASSPSSASAARAIDSAFDSERAAARGSSRGNSSSQARSRVTLRPGLTSSSAHSRRALGRGHGPADRAPACTVNSPSSRARTVALAGASCVIPVATRSLSRARPTFPAWFLAGLLSSIPAAGRAGLRPAALPATGTPREQRLRTVVTEVKNNEHLVPAV